MTALSSRQPLHGRARKATYTDTNTLERPAPANKQLPGSYTDVDVLTKGKTAPAVRPGSYADVHTVIGRMSAGGSQGRYTDADR